MIHTAKYTEKHIKPSPWHVYLEEAKTMCLDCAINVHYNPDNEEKDLRFNCRERVKTCPICKREITYITVREY